MATNVAISAAVAAATGAALYPALSTAAAGPLGLSAAAIVGGVVAKNSTEQLGGRLHPELSQAGTALGSTLFVGGWVAMAYYLAQQQRSPMKKAQLAIPSLLIMTSVMMMKSGQQQAVPMELLATVFAGSWVALGYFGAPVGMKSAGLSVSALVLLSMMVFLPQQRAMGVVDGPGLPLFVLAWVVFLQLRNSPRIALGDF